MNFESFFKHVKYTHICNTSKSIEKAIEIEQKKNIHHRKKHHKIIEKTIQNENKHIEEVNLN